MKMHCTDEARVVQVKEKEKDLPTAVERPREPAPMSNPNSATSSTGSLGSGGATSPRVPLELTASPRYAKVLLSIGGKFEV